MSSFSKLSNDELIYGLQFWEILQRVFMYLAALGPQKSLLSTYFIANLDDVGGGGALQNHSQKNKG